MNKTTLLSTTLFLLFGFLALSQADNDLDQNFKNPTHSANPLTWMHVMGGNVSEVGMTKDLGVLWKSPHIIDITYALKTGKNELRIEVTNQWTNRLIGDENFPNVSGYDLRPHLKKTLLLKDPQLSFINRYQMVD